MTDPSAKPAVAVDHLSAQLAAYHGLEKQIRELTEMRDRVRQAITQALGDNEIGTVNGSTAVRYTKIIQRRLSPSLLRTKFSDDDLVDCYSEVESRRLQVL